MSYSQPPEKLYDYVKMLNDLWANEKKDGLLPYSVIEILSKCFDSLKRKKKLSIKQEQYILKAFNTYCIPKKWENLSCK